MDSRDFCLFCQICILSGFIKNLFKAIVKQNLVQPILSAVFPILCDASAEEEADDEDEDEVVAKTPSSVAAQVGLHSLAFFVVAFTASNLHYMMRNVVYLHEHLYSSTFVLLF